MEQYGLVGHYHFRVNATYAAYAIVNASIILVVPL